MPVAPAPIVTPDADALLDYRQAAQRLRLSVRSVQDLVAAGSIRVVRLGRAVRFDAADLADFVNRAKSGGPAPVKPTPTPAGRAAIAAALARIG